MNEMNGINKISTIQIEDQVEDKSMDTSKDEDEKENTDVKVYITTIAMLIIVIVVIVIKVILMADAEIEPLNEATFHPLEQQIHSNFKYDGMGYLPQIHGKYGDQHIMIGKKIRQKIYNTPEPEPERNLDQKL